MAYLGMSLNSLKYRLFLQLQGMLAAACTVVPSEQPSTSTSDLDKWSPHTHQMAQELEDQSFQPLPLAFKPQGRCSPLMFLSSYFVKLHDQFSSSNSANYYTLVIITFCFLSNYHVFLSAKEILP